MLNRTPYFLLLGVTQPALVSLASKVKGYGPQLRGQSSTRGERSEQTGGSPEVLFHLASHWCTYSIWTEGRSKDIKSYSSHFDFQHTHFQKTACNLLKHKHTKRFPLFCNFFWCELYLHGKRYPKILFGLENQLSILTGLGHNPNCAHGWWMFPVPAWEGCTCAIKQIYTSFGVDSSLLHLRPE